MQDIHRRNGIPVDQTAQALGSGIRVPASQREHETQDVRKVSGRGTTEGTETGFWQSSRHIVPKGRAVNAWEGGEVRPKRPTEGKVASGLPFVDVTHRRDIEPTKRCY